MLRRYGCSVEVVAYCYPQVEEVERAALREGAEGAREEEIKEILALYEEVGNENALIDKLNRLTTKSKKI